MARQGAHVLERAGLAMAGAAAGLFVGTHVGSAIAAFPSIAFLIVMMIAGAVGFYLGIDTPPHRFRALSTEITRGWSAGKIDIAELLTAVGTFLAALTFLISVFLIVLGLEPHISWTVVLFVAWVAGTLMQIVAGTMSRIDR